MLVLDCSLAMAWCFADEADDASDAVLDLVAEAGAVVPALWYWEVGNVLVIAERRGRMTASDVQVRLNLLSALPIQVDLDSHSQAWQETQRLARQHSLTVYDASYLELAVRHGAALATRDQALAGATLSAGLKVLP